MTKDNWIKTFDNVFSHTGLHNRIFGYGVETRLKDFISQVEKDAIEKTNKRWRERIDDSKIISSIGYRPSKFRGLSTVAIYNQALSDLLEDKK